MRRINSKPSISGMPISATITSGLTGAIDLERLAADVAVVTCAPAASQNIAQQAQRVGFVVDREHAHAREIDEVLQRDCGAPPAGARAARDAAGCTIIIGSLTVKVAP